MKELVNYWGFKLAYFLALFLASIKFTQVIFPPMATNFGLIPAIVIGVATGYLYGYLADIVLGSIRDHYNK